MQAAQRIYGTMWIVHPGSSLKPLVQIKSLLGFPVLICCCSTSRTHRDTTRSLASSKKVADAFCSSLLSRWPLRQNHFQVTAELRSCAPVVATWNYLGREISVSPPSISRTNGRRSTAYCSLRQPAATSAACSAPASSLRSTPGHLSSAHLTGSGLSSNRLSCRVWMHRSVCGCIGVLLRP